MSINSNGNTMRAFCTYIVRHDLHHGILESDTIINMCNGKQYSGKEVLSFIKTA